MLPWMLNCRVAVDAEVAKASSIKAWLSPLVGASIHPDIANTLQFESVIKHNYICIHMIICCKYIYMCVCASVCLRYNIVHIHIYIYIHSTHYRTRKENTIWPESAAVTLNC